MRHNRRNNSFLNCSILSYLFIIAIITLLFVQPISLAPIVKAEDDSSLFTIAQCSDQQFLSKYWPSLYNSTYQWIAENAPQYNIRMVINTGDFVQDNYNLTQWDTVNQAYSFLVTNNIPYCWLAGNHDQLDPNGQGSDNGTNWNGSNGSWLANNYSAFNLDTFRAKPFYAGDYGSGKNTAAKFSYYGFNFLIINIEYKANSSAMEWVTNTINSYSGYNVMLNTHAYLNSTGGYSCNDDNGVWEITLYNYAQNHPQIFLITSGHTGSAGIWGYSQTIGTRQEIFFNRQGANATQLGSSIGRGAASVRLYTFNLTSGLVTTSTYDVLQSAFMNSSNSSPFMLKQASFSFVAYVYPEGYIPPPTSTPIITPSPPSVTSIAKTPSSTLRPTPSPTPTFLVSPTVSPTNKHNNKPDQTIYPANLFSLIKVCFFAVTIIMAILVLAVLYKRFLTKLQNSRT
jgi:3',5'-cyclic AMP phosphodiesterase CpdA